MHYSLGNRNLKGIRNAPGLEKTTPSGSTRNKALEAGWTLLSNIAERTNSLKDTCVARPPMPEDSLRPLIKSIPDEHLTSSKANHPQRDA